MKLKKLGLFVCFCLCISATYAKDVKYPVDTIALEEALNEITKVGDSSNSNDIAEAQASFYLYFIENTNKQIPVNEIIVKCKEIVKNNVSCLNFIKAYNSYLDRANFCTKTNNFSIKNFSFQDCKSILADYENQKTPSNEVSEYFDPTVKKECKKYISSAQPCLTYLQKYYKQKLSNKNLSEIDKTYYNCLLSKVTNGNEDFPIYKMEGYCEYIANQ